GQRLIDARAESAAVLARKAEQSDERKDRDQPADDVKRPRPRSAGPQQIGAGAKAGGHGHEPGSPEAAEKPIPDAAEQGALVAGRGEQPEQSNQQQQDGTDLADLALRQPWLRDSPS